MIWDPHLYFLIYNLNFSGFYNKIYSLGFTNSSQFINISILLQSVYLFFCIFQIKIIKYNFLFILLIISFFWALHLSIEALPIS
jgi:hypothetical protein